ncbi:MAG: (d)CMP kinase [Proteobacteria bacterium]|nr:(d)CMP kinase [Pseudomonadota bacterium]
MTHRIITIDGPAGAGKTTISNIVARQLGCVYVDTGALYRGVAYEIHKQDVNWKDDSCLGSFLGSLDLNFLMGNNYFVLISSGKDITSHIRTPEISMLASATSARPQVRAALLNIQRNIARHQDAVFEGRDMGTVVFPDADFKFFLFADLAVRARRRYEEMSQEKTDIQKVEQDMKKRDANDSQRKEAPLKAAPDAVKIDSSHLTIPEVVTVILKNIQKG